MWPELIPTTVFTLLRTAPVITIKQLLSLDIIKAHQNVEGWVNPPVAHRPKTGSGAEREGWGWGGASEYRQIDRQMSRQTWFMVDTI